LDGFGSLANVHFVPDVFGNLVFNDVASDVIRQSYLYGAQFDAFYQLNDVHKLRAGFAVSVERTNVTNASTVLPVDPVTGGDFANPIPDYRLQFAARLEHRDLCARRVEALRHAYP
jgi:hypothetical protein